MENISSNELVEWKAYFSERPFSDEREDFRAAMICAAIYNSKRTERNQKVFSPSDFLPKFERKEIQTNKTNSISSEEFQNKARLFRMLMSS